MIWERAEETELVGRSVDEMSCIKKFKLLANVYDNLCITPSSDPPLPAIIKDNVAVFYVLHVFPSICCLIKKGVIFA